MIAQEKLGVHTGLGRVGCERHQHPSGQSEAGHGGGARVIQGRDTGRRHLS